MKNLSLKTLLIIFFSLLIGIILLWKFVLPKQKISATWWNDNWNYRKSISVNNTGGNQSNVYITLSLDTSDSSRFQDDCGDIRFTDEQNTLLNYYIVSGCSTPNTSIHVNFPILTDGNNTFYLYYGNSYIQNGFSTSDFSTPATNSTPSSKSEEEKVSLKKVKIPSKLSQEIFDKYAVSGSAFTRELRDNPKDKIEVEVGDINKTDSFVPKVKLKRWDDEVNISVKLIDNDSDDPVISTNQDKIKWTKQKREVNFYELPASTDFPEGGYEFEITLKEKPTTNKVEFNLETKGLEFFYQPPLTPKEINEGASRPENVVGSYAVYYKNSPINIIDQKEYKTGKAFHIYRPRIEDANGNWVWGVLNVDEINSLLTVTIPQEFLDNAVYPITHAAGLTFGYTSVGASTNGYLKDRMFGLNVVAPATGTIDSITGYFDNFTGVNVKGIFVNSSLNIVTNGISTSAYTTSSTGVWLTLPFTTPPSITASSEYYLMAIGDTSIGYKYDAGSALTGEYIREDLTNSYSSPQDPTDASVYQIKLSVYATYTAGANDIAKIGTDTSASGNGATLAFSHTLVSGSNRLVVVTAGIENGGGAYDISGITYGGVAMTKAVGDTTGVSGAIYLGAIWYLLESNLPSNGANSVVITGVGATVALPEVNGWVGEYINVNQGAPEATDSTVYIGTNKTIQNDISPSNDAWVISMVGAGNPTTPWTHSLPQIELLDFSDASSSFAVAELRGANGETALTSTTTGTVNRSVRMAASWGTYTPPNPPSSCLIKESPTDTYLIPKWADNSSDENGFQIQKNTDGLGFSFLTNLAAGITAYQDNSVSSNHTYSYRVNSYATESGSTLYSTPNNTVAFGAGVTYPKAIGTSAPIAITSADFNGDGKIDLATASEDSRIITVYLNIGGTFGIGTTYSGLGSRLSSITAANFDNTNQSDIAAISYWENKLIIYFNNGNGTFSTGITYPMSGYPTSITKGDFNNDNNIDLATANNSGNNFSIFLNNGTGSFSLSNYSVTAGITGLWSITAADYNNDDKDDIAIGSYDNDCLNVFLNDGDGTFSSGTTSPTTGNEPRGLTSADLNNDGKSDVISANNGSSNISVFLNLGGTLGTGTTYPSPVGGGRSVTSANLNSDGHIDIATANGNGGALISVFRNTGLGGTAIFNIGSTSFYSTIGNLPEGITSGDFNGDGKIDLATANIGGSNVTVFSNGTTLSGWANCPTLDLSTGNFKFEGVKMEGVKIN